MEHQVVCTNATYAVTQTHSRKARWCRPLSVSRRTKLLFFLIEKSIVFSILDHFTRPLIISLGYIKRSEWSICFQRTKIFVAFVCSELYRFQSSWKAYQVLTIIVPSLGCSPVLQHRVLYGHLQHLMIYYNSIELE